MKKVRNYDSKMHFGGAISNFLDEGSLHLKKCRSNLVVNGVGAPLTSTPSDDPNLNMNEIQKKTSTDYICQVHSLQNVTETSTK